MASSLSSTAADEVLERTVLAGGASFGNVGPYERLRGRLEQFIGNYPEMFELVRGRGLMLGVKMKIEPRPFVAHMRDNHQLLTVAAGDMTFRVLPPLVIDDSHIDEFMDKLSAATASYAVEAVPA
jgi:acetylornithine/N-succinyldiaminopimelate aminotransferase